MAGNQLKFYTVEHSDDILYYQGKGRWVSGLHDAAHCTEELAQRIAKRYPGSKVEQHFGYDVHYKINLVDVGEPETEAAITGAVRLAKRDGWSLETLMLQTERAFHADGNTR